jgi:hypothetical protein
MVRAALLLNLLVGASPALARPASTWESVALFDSFAALQADQPREVLELGVIRRDVGLDWTSARVELASLDLTVSAAQAYGPVYAFRVGDETWVNPAAPAPGRQREYARLELWGDLGLLQSRSCYWVTWTSGEGQQEGRVQCDLVLNLLDLATGELTLVNRRTAPELFADAPDLVERLSTDRPRGPLRLRDILVAWLERQAG